MPLGNVVATLIRIYIVITGYALIICSGNIILPLYFIFKAIMYIKTTNSRGHQYLQIIESYRDKRKIKQRVLVNLGRADILADKGLENIVASLNKFVKKGRSKLRDISSMKENRRVNYGYIAFKNLWNKFSLSNLLTNLIRKRKIQFNFIEIVFSLVVNRLLNPSSKLYHYQHLDRYFELSQEIELHQFYRTLDILAENKETIEESIFDKNRNLFNMKIDVVFYDVTTYHFESQISDELRDFGFSKAIKINEVQVVMGLIIDSEGRPIGYELFPGNTFEGKTMLKVLEKLKEKFMLENVIIVADKGLNSKLNFLDIKSHGFDYIVSARIKNMSSKTKVKILSEEGYKTLSSQENDEDDHIYKYKVIDYENMVKKEQREGRKSEIIKLEEKLVCSYSSKRAAKNRRDRQRAIEKAEKIIKEKNYSQLKEKKGYKRYIKTKGQEEKVITECKLDYERIEKEALFDGYSALQTSRKDLSPEKIIEQYHSLYKIEESFRILKSTMQTRPIFLRTKKHIEGHFVMCFLAFLLERELELRLRKRSVEFSPEKIKEALNMMEFSEVKIENEIYFLKGKHNNLTSKIFSTLRLKQPANILAHEDALSYANQ